MHIPLNLPGEEELLAHIISCLFRSPPALTALTLGFYVFSVVGIEVAYAQFVGGRPAVHHFPLLPACGHCMDALRPGGPDNPEDLVHELSGAHHQGENGTQYVQGLHQWDESVPRTAELSQGVCPRVSSFKHMCSKDFWKRWQADSELKCVCVESRF